MDNTAIYKGNQNQFTADSRIVQREVKSNIHKELLNRLDLSFLDQLSRPQLDAQIGQIAREIMDELQVRLNSLERAEVIKQVQDEVSGLGPIESLISDLLHPQRFLIHHPETADSVQKLEHLQPL